MFEQAMTSMKNFQEGRGETDINEELGYDVEEAISDIQVA